MSKMFFFWLMITVLKFLLTFDPLTSTSSSFLKLLLLLIGIKLTGLSILLKFWLISKFSSSFKQLVLFRQDRLQFFEFTGLRKISDFDINKHCSSVKFFSKYVKGEGMDVFEEFWINSSVFQQFSVARNKMSVELKMQEIWISGCDGKIVKFVDFSWCEQKSWRPIRWQEKLDLFWIRYCDLTFWPVWT